MHLSLLDVREEHVHLRARPVHLIITMIKWIRTSRSSIKDSLSLHLCLLDVREEHVHLRGLDRRRVRARRDEPLPCRGKTVA